MALSRRNGQRFQGAIWPGFVDAVTGLLMVLIFVLTIFMVVQYVLRETITGQDKRLDALSSEIAALAQALGMEQRRSEDLGARVGELNATLTEARTEAEAQEALIAALRGDLGARDAALAEAATRLTAFEAQVAALLADRDTALARVATLEGDAARLITEQEALNLALAAARSEIDAGVEAARLAAARRAALEALIADLNARNAEGVAQAQALGAQVSDLTAQLSDEEAARLAEAAAAEALRARLQGADAELTAMTLALEAQRQRAEDTLTLLAAAEAAGADLNARLAAALTAGDGAAGALASAEAQIAALRQSEADLRARLAAARADGEGTAGALTDATAEIAALQAVAADLRARLATVEDGAAQAQAAAAAQIAALSLSEEEIRARLVAALAAKLAAEAQADTALTEAEQRAALLAQANRDLQAATADSTAAQREQALLNQQVAALRTQLGQLQALLDDYKDRQAADQVQVQTLGADLNAALARAAAEERRRRELEEAERLRLQAANQDLERYRSEFFGRLRDVLGAQEGVRISGDRFVFSSEVLFAPGQAVLSGDGQREIAKVATILRNVAGDIPDGIDWVIRVDGHTDNVPLSGAGPFRDNWELSQARALSVVRYMVEFLGIPPDRLSANGFGQYQPVASGNSAEARAQNRRIELKFTEK